MQLQNLLNDGKSQPMAAMLIAIFRPLGRPQEESGSARRIYSDPAVGYLNADPITVHLQAHADITISRRMPDRVVQQIGHHPFNHADVCADIRKMRINMRCNPLLPGQCRQLQFLDDVLCQFLQRETLEHGLHHAEFHLRQF